MLARDRGGALWGFELDFDYRDGALVLDTAPLVRVERIDPEGRREHETPEVPEVPVPPPAAP